MPQPTAVTFVMEPFLPGTYAVLTVGGANDATRVFALPLASAPSAHPASAPGSSGTPAAPAAAPINLPIAQRTDETLTVDVPPGAVSAYAISTDANFDPATAFVVNVPRLDWTFPSRGQGGGEMRLLGRNLVSADQYPPDARQPRSMGGLLAGQTRVVARLRGGKTFIDIPVEKSSAYEARLRLPPNLGAGEYDLFAHNTLGGDWGWSEPLTVAIDVAREPWPATVFRVDDYLFRGRGLDTDAAFAAALADIAANAGGVLELGPRVYHVTRTIVLPPRTVLRGAGRERTMIHLPGPGQVRPPFVAVTGDRDFIVEDLRIESVYAPYLIYAPRFVPEMFDEAFTGGNKSLTNRAANVTVRRCHLVQRPQEHADRRPDKAHLERVREYVFRGPQELEGIQAIQVSGSDITVVDNLVIGGGGCVALNRCDHARVAGNVLKAGPSGTSIICFGRMVWPEGHPTNSTGAQVDGSYCRQLLIEDNDLTAHSERARNLVALLYGGEDLYVARNHIHDIEPNSDAEALLTHLWSARWSQPRLRMTAPTTGRIIDPTGEVTHENLLGACVDIVAGRGVGQVRRIIKREGDLIEIDRPFRADPDESSVTVFTAPPPFWRLAFVDNRVVSSAVNIIVWGNSCDTVLDGNYTADGPGITVWSVRFKGDQKVWGGAAFTSVINNTVDRGWSTPATEAGALGGAVGILTLYALDTTCTAEGYDILGLVIRNNLAVNNTGIGVRVTLPAAAQDGKGIQSRRVHDAGIVVEKNHCRDSVVGVAIEQEARAVERGNTSENVHFPLVWVPALG